MAQTDVTAKYLTNWGFDENFDYTASDAKTVSQEMLEVDGWTKDFSIDYTITGVYEFGTATTFNGASVPASGYDGSAGGLALSTGWTQSLKFYQEITLPVGSYALVSAFYNGGTKTVGASLVGWIDNDGTSTLSALSSFPKAQWVVDTVRFIVSETNGGKVQIGFKAGSNGSANSAKVVLDFVKLLDMGRDTSILEESIAAAQSAYGDGTATGASTLLAAIESAQSVLNDNSSTMEDIINAAQKLDLEVKSFNMANASEDNPYDATSYITDPNFEDNGLGSWTSDGLQTQTNSSFTKKSGSVYVEKWTSSGSVGDGYAKQTITGLPNGTYKLTVAAQNYSQKSTSTLNEGAYIFGNNDTTTVTLPDDYSVTFVVSANKANIGFVAEGATGNWIACDNFRLYYLGVDVQALKDELNSLVEKAESLLDTTTKANSEDIYELKEAIEKAKVEMETETLDNITDVTEGIQNAIAKVEESAIAYSILAEAISNANSYYDADGVDAETLKAAIDAAQALYDSDNASATDLTETASALDEAAYNYRMSNASEDNPIDYTSYIKNPSFEENGKEYWTTDMELISRNVFSLKSGTYFLNIRIWESKYGDHYVQQNIKLPLGKFVLKVDAQNSILDTQGRQADVYLFAGDERTTISSANTYNLTFTNLEDSVDIGIKTENTQANWILCDNFQLYFLGNSSKVIAEEIQKRITDAETLLDGSKMNTAVRNGLETALEPMRNLNGEEDDETIKTAAKALKEAMKEAEASADLYGDLKTAIENSDTLYVSDTNGSEEYKLAIDSAVSVYDNTESTNDELKGAIEMLERADLAFKIANASESGVIPVVVTNPFVARGTTVMFGRSTVSGVEETDIKEKGFCWSTNQEPTVLDSRSTDFIENNGNIYRMKGLTPATVYYVRAYAMTNDFNVGYGDVVKVITLPLGNITYTYNDGGDVLSNDRIRLALEEGCEIWRNLTSIKGFKVTCKYGASTPTADCNYGGSMRIGPYSAFQCTGTVMHEMSHGVGVGTHSIWYGPSCLRENSYSGTWLGDRATKVLRFIENSDTTRLTGNSVHMWPYGINNPSEDTGELRRIGQSLIVQALGEDGLPPTGGFCTPAWCFQEEENVKYYIKNESETYGLTTSYLMASSDDKLAIVQASATEALNDDNFAWYISFDPETCYYTFKNVGTGKYLSYKSSGTNGILVAEKTSISSNEMFHLMQARINTTIGEGDDAITTRGYWIIHPTAVLNPYCLNASSSGKTSALAFNLENSATKQRWILLKEDEVNAVDVATRIDNVKVSRSRLMIDAFADGVYIACNDSQDAGKLDICSVDGRVVKSVVLQMGTQIAVQLPRGVYIIDGQKVYVK